MRAGRWTAVLLGAVMLLGLAGCGKDPQEKVKKIFQTSPYYTQEAIPTVVETGDLTGCCTDGQSIWYLSVPEEGAPPALCRVPLDGAAAEILPDYRTETEEGNSWGPFMGGDGKLWIWERFIARQDGKNVRTYQMRQLDPGTGKELSVVDITAAMEELEVNSQGGLAVDQAGTIYLSDKRRILAVDGQGEIVCTLKASMPGGYPAAGDGGPLTLLADGTIGAVTIQPGDKREVRSIDPKTRDWTGQAYPLNKKCSRIFTGKGGCAFYYINQNVVYGVLPGEEVPLRLLPWSNAQLDHPGAVACFVLEEDGRAVIFSNITGTGLYGGQLEVTRLLPTEEDPQTGKTKLVYGTIGIDWMMQQKISKFNQSNTAYRIEIRDYSEGMLDWKGEKNPQVYQSALARIYADITSGQGPDILDDSLPLDKLANQGAMEDLWPWIDGDPEISREGLMDHVLECMEVDGKLPQVCSGFEIETAVASAAVAGDRTSWTMEEMLNAFGGEMPEFYFGGADELNLIYATFNRFDRKSTLYNLAGRNLGRYINWETGECSFDGEDFKSLLQITGGLEEAVDTGLDLNDWQIRNNLGLSDSGMELDTVEPCRVFPWEGKPLLYSRTLSDAKDLVIDDVLFGGGKALTDYERRLWDAEIIYVQGVTEFSHGEELIRTRYFTDQDHPEWMDNGFMKIQSTRYKSSGEKFAADFVEGGADREIYASYIGFPVESGSSSSFIPYECMGISSASKAKEGAWAFVRGQLFPLANATGIDTQGNPIWPKGFSINREAFDEQMQMGPKYWTDPYTGELFLDGNGDPVEYSRYGIGVGHPGDIVLTAYLFAPTEAQMDRFWRLYNATDCVAGTNDALLDIITEQAEPYFAGDKSLEETVSLIQNRAKLYVDETR